MFCILGLMACTKVPERFSATIDGQLVTYEWTSISVEMIPVYSKDIKSGYLRPLKELDKESWQKINQELSKNKPTVYYKPRMRINEETYNKAVEKVSTLFKIPKDAAKQAIPPKEEWEISLRHTDLTEKRINAEPQLVTEYFDFASNLPHESVNFDLSNLYAFLKEQAEFIKASETAMRLISPQSAYAVRTRDNQNTVALLVVPEDSEWGVINAYYQSRR